MPVSDVYQEPPDGVTPPKPDYLYHGSRKCRGCSSIIHWWETPNGKMSPHDADGVSHFATCPRQAEFRRKGNL